MSLRDEAIKAMELGQKRGWYDMMVASLPPEHPMGPFTPDTIAVEGFTLEALDGLLGWLREHGDILYAKVEPRKPESDWSAVLALVELLSEEEQ